MKTVTKPISKIEKTMLGTRTPHPVTFSSGQLYWHCSSDSQWLQIRVLGSSVWPHKRQPSKHCICSNPRCDLHSVVSVGTFPGVLTDPVMLLQWPHALQGFYSCLLCCLLGFFCLVWCFFVFVFWGKDFKLLLRIFHILSFQCRLPHLSSSEI